jgi:hypothetical protein
MGVVHSRGPWTMELTGAAAFYTANDEFWNGNRLEQDPMWSLESHLIYTFSPGFWLGERSSINHVEKNDRCNQFSYALTMSASISPQVGFKIAYLGSRTQERFGADLDTLAVAITLLWWGDLPRFEGHRVGRLTTWPGGVLSNSANSAAQSVRLPSAPWYHV